MNSREKHCRLSKVRLIAGLLKVFGVLIFLHISTTNSFSQNDILSLLDSAQLKQENEPLVALDYALMAKARAISEKNQLLLSKSYFQIGKIYRILGKLSEAEKNLNMALSYKMISQEMLADYYNEKGVILKQQCRFDEALELYEQTLVIQRSLKDVKGEARSYNNIGRIYEAMDNFPEAMRYYRNALIIYEKFPVSKSAAITLQNIGNIYRFTLKNDSALVYYKKALTIYEISGNKLLTAYAYNSIAAVSTNQDLAISYLNKSIEIQKELNAEADLSKSYVELAEVYIKNNQSGIAIPYLLNAYELLAFSGHKTGVSEALKHLFKSYETIGDYKNALKYQTLYFVYEDSIKSENNLNAIQKYESELKLKDKETKIAIQDVKIKSSEEKLRIKRVQVFYFIIGVVLLSALLLIVLLQVRKQKKNNTLLKKQKAMIEKSDKEKEVLIREVHHRVKNNLQIISSLFTIEQRKSNNTEVRDALSYGKQRIEAMSIIHEKLYKQSDLSNINLEDYIFEIAENLLDSYDKVNSINVKVNSDVSSIDTDVAINLGLIVAELMTNSIKHGFSPENENFVIIISIKQTENSIRFDYSDNGRGVGHDFDINSSQNFGHRLIVSIVKKLKGEIIQDIVAQVGFKFSFIFKDLRDV